MRSKDRVSIGWGDPGLVDGVFAVDLPVHVPTEQILRLPIAEQFAHQLFGLQENAEGRAILAKLPISNFEAASDETYQPVRAFLEVFAKTVRPIE